MFQGSDWSFLADCNGIKVPHFQTEVPTVAQTDRDYDMSKTVSHVITLEAQLMLSTIYSGL